MSLITNLIENESQQVLTAATQAAARGATDAPFVDPQEEDQGEFFDLKDVALAPVRGIEGFAQSIYNLADAVSLDALPNWENRFFGESTSTSGKFVEVATQFLTGFIPAAGLVGKVGQAVSLGSKVAKAGKGIQMAAKLGKGAIQGGIADFISFDGQMERLSNFIQEVPELENPVTEYLAASKDDGEIEGRFKNVIEGLFLQVGINGVAQPFINGIKSIKEYKAGIAEGLNKTESASRASTILEETGVVDSLKNLDEPVIKELTDLNPNVIPAELPAKQMLTLDSFKNPDEFYRVIRGDEAFQDIVESGVVRTNAKTKIIDPNARIASKLTARPTSFPSFAKGSVSEGYIKGDNNHYIITSSDSSLKPSTTGTHGKGSTMFPTDASGKHLTELAGSNVDVYKHVGEGQYELVYSKGKAVSTSKKTTVVGGTDVVVPPTKGEVFDPLTPIEASNPSLRITDRAKRSGSQDYLDVLAKAEGLGNMAEVTQLLAKGDLSISAAEKLRIEGLTGEDKLATLKSMNAALGLGTDSIVQKFGTAIPESFNPVFVQTHLAFTGVRLSGAKAVEAAKELQVALKSGKNEDAVLLTEAFTKKFQQFTEWNMLYGMHASGAGTLLNQIGKNKRSFTTKAEIDELVPTKKIPENLDPAAHKAEIAKFQKEKWGSAPMEEIAKKFSAAASFDDLEKQLNVMTQLSQVSRGRRGFDALQSVWRNSILSGPSSFVVAVLGNTVTNNLKTLESIIGAGIVGDIKSVKSIFKAATTFQSFGEISDAAVAAFKTGEDPLTGGASAFVETGKQSFNGREFSGQSLGFKDGSTMGQAVDWLSEFSSIPGRLLVAPDAVAKQSAYARAGRAHYMYEGYNKGMNGMEAAKYAEMQYRKTVLDGGKMYNEKNLFDQHVAEAKKAGLDWAKDPKEFERFVQKQAELKPFDPTIAEDAKRFAEISKVVTFTNDLDDVSQGISTIINKVPGLNFVIPFVKTPTNILKFGLARSPLGLAKDSYLLAFSKDFREQFVNARGAEANELRGRIATAVMFTSGVSYYLMNNEGAITGGGPQNKDEKATLIATGWQPYSLKIGDKYVSYQRLDPIATPLGILADLAEFSRLNPKEKEDDEMAEVFSACAMTLTYNLTDKSYLRGLNNLMKAVQDPGTYLPKLVRDIGAGFVPNAVNQMQNTEHEIILRDSRSFADATLRRIPGASETVAPQRTILGDVVFRENPLGLLGPASPINISTAKNDVVAQELSTLNGHFGMPSSKLHGLNDLDMRKFSNENGQPAYDRWMELSGTVKINGKTLKQALASAIKTKEYQALPKKLTGEAIEMKSQRINVINRIIRGYRNQAQIKVLGEYPELYEKRNRVMEQQRAIRLGKFENQQ